MSGCFASEMIGRQLMDLRVQICTILATLSSIIENSKTAHLLTNHRSNKKIVEEGNALMEGRGKPSTPHRETEGLVHIECVDDVKH